QRRVWRARHVAGFGREQDDRAGCRDSHRTGNRAHRRAVLRLAHHRTTGMTVGRSTPPLTIAQVSAGYRARRVLHDLTLPPITAGRVTALVGPNGAGKSTLLRVLAGLLPARGSVRLGEKELVGASIDAHAAHVSFMPQLQTQRIGLTVLESVIAALEATPLRERPLGASGRRHRAAAVLERVGIGDLALEPIGHLSGGQRQLASLAQAIVREPDVLLL